MEKVRIGIAGAGFAARFHLDAYKRVYKVPIDLVGLTSLTRDSRERLASENDVKSFDSLEQMLKEVDVVDVCAPPYAHEKIAVAALEGDCHVIMEKPLTGYYGDGSSDFRGNIFSKETMLRDALSSANRIVSAAQRSKKKVMYAENWVYSPSIQKELEILRSSKGQILWMIGEESHSGSHADNYGNWAMSGGGSLMGKACHPLTAMLYLKKQEGISRDGKAIRAESVNANVHEITRLDSFTDAGFLRTRYKDVEDYAQLHVTFSDGTVADVFSSELVLGGIHSWLEVFANNHRTKCRISPIETLDTYNPKEELLREVYVMEKIGTKQGWNTPSVDENWFNGYYQEIQDFVESVYYERDPVSDLDLGRECVKIMYGGYVSAERGGEKFLLPK
jgi:predicted dehydrogenase